MSLSDNIQNRSARRADGGAEPASRAKRGGVARKVVADVDESTVAVNADGSTTPVNADESAGLTHELANLLDGSLRQVALALGELTDEAAAAAERSGDVGSRVGPVSHAATVVRLEAASTAMVRMAQLLKRWVGSPNRGDAASLYSTEATLAEAAGYVRQLLEPRLSVGGIGLRIDLPDGLAGLSAGPIYHVLANAVRNSIEAIVGAADSSVAGGHSIAATFSLEEGGDWLRLVVTDTGPGLDAELPRDSAGHIRAGSTTKPTGHGLGLAISRQIVESLGGTLRLGNGADGGATLTVCWPSGPSAPVSG